MIVHDVTGLVLRFLLGAVLEAHARGVLTPATTPELWAHVEAILAWCATPGDETTGRDGWIRSGRAGRNKESQ